MSNDVHGCKTKLAVSQDIGTVELFLKSDSEETQRLRHLALPKM